MLMLSLVRTFAASIRLLRNLATSVLARSLNLPAPLVHGAGIFVFAQVQTFENRFGRALCPIRLLRQLRSLFR